MIAIRAEFSEARIVLLSTFEGDAEIHSALQAGARGYLLKSMPPPELIEMIRRVHSGMKTVPAAVAVRLAEHLSDEALTAREIEVLQRVADGNRNREIRLLLQRYREAGIRDISHDFYPGGRHEMLNEINRDAVRLNLLCWISRVLSGASQTVASKQYQLDDPSTSITH